MAFFDAALGLGGAALGGYFASRENRKARKGLARAGRAAEGDLRAGYDDALGFLDQGHGDASKYLTPYVDSGQAGQKLYHDALGINGGEAQKSYHDDFQDDPGFQDGVDYSLNQVERSFANRGGVNSGRAMIALADNARKAKYGAYQDRLSHLRGVGELGFNASRGLADLAYNTGTNKASYRTNLASALASNAISGAGGQAQAHSNNANIIGNTLSGLGYQFGRFNGETSGQQEAQYNPINELRDVGSYLPSFGQELQGRQSQQRGLKRQPSANDLTYYLQG